MKSTIHTGGLKEFRYNGDEEYKDTKHTKAFKEDLRRHRKEEHRDCRDWYQHDTQISRPEFHNPKRHRRWWVHILLFLIFVGAIYHFAYKLENMLQPGNLTNITPVAGEVIDKVLLTKYFDEEYDGQYLIILGHLQKDGAEYLVDNSGNKIKLTNLRNPQKVLFSTTKSVDVYGVRGILHKIGSDLSLQVRSLEKVLEEEPKPAPEPEPELVIEDEGKLIDVAKEKIDGWWKRIGERFDEALAGAETRPPKVVLSPENMELVEKDKCGEGQIKSWGKCVSICKDKTHYGTCSSTHPLYCYEGDLVPIPSKCGCPYGQDVVGDECLDKLKAIERLILKYTNAERSAYGLATLAWDSKLAVIAREHSEDMASQGFFDHVNLRGEDPSDRAQRKGYGIMKTYGGGYRVGIAENIGMMPTGNVIGMGYVSSDADNIAKAHVQSWMESSGHRKNILDSSYEKLGVGVSYDSTYYIATQNFW